MVTDWLGRLLVRDPEGGIQCQHENRPGGRGRRSLRPTSGLLRARAVPRRGRHLAADLQVAATIVYTYGWRTQSEVLTLERRQLHLDAGTLRLEPGTTKNDDGRLVHLTREVKALLQDQLERVDALQRKLGRIVPYLFPYLSGKRRAGQRRRDFRKAWTAACSAVGLAGRLRHDFRRTAVRNLERAGVPRSQAMKITGHRTEAVYRRYAIVSEADVREAVQKLDGYIHGHSSRGALDERRATL
jgi:integrase